MAYRFCSLASACRCRAEATTGHTVFGFWLQPEGLFHVTTGGGPHRNDAHEGQGSVEFGGEARKGEGSFPHEVGHGRLEIDKAPEREGSSAFISRCARACYTVP